MDLQLSIGSFVVSFRSARSRRCLACGAKASRFKDKGGQPLCTACANAMRNQNTTEYQPSPYISRFPPSHPSFHPVERIERLSKTSQKHSLEPRRSARGISPAQSSTAPHRVKSSAINAAR